MAVKTQKAFSKDLVVNQQYCQHDLRILTIGKLRTLGGCGYPIERVVSGSGDFVDFEDVVINLVPDLSWEFLKRERLGDMAGHTKFSYKLH